MKRYLFFSYNFSARYTNGHGNMYFECRKFPSCETIVVLAKEKVAGFTQENESDIKIIILGWQEMTKTDFINFNKNPHT